MARPKVLNRAVALALMLAGVILVIAGPGASGRAAGAFLIAGGLIVAAVGFLLERSFRDQRDREREERARQFFERRGRWPRQGEPLPPSRTGRDVNR